MSKREQFEYEIISDFLSGGRTRAEAARSLGVHPRTVTRKANRVRKYRMAGVKHGNTGKKPVNRLDDKNREECMKLVREEYFDFNMTHCLEKIAEEQDIETPSYTTFRKWCRAEGLAKTKRRRPSKKRMLRERMSNEGLMIQMDGSHHTWNGKDKWCLIGGIDDATSEIPYVGFFAAENTFSCMHALRRIIELKGIPESVYVDKAGCFAGMNERAYTQFVRACEEIGIVVIPAHSPQAKGRIERAWKTFQDRLIPEMRRAGIQHMPAANNYIQQHFLKSYWNKRNTVIPRQDETRYRAMPEDMNLDEIFCQKHVRKVRRDHTISYANKTYKLIGGFVGNLSGRDVQVHEYEDGSWRVYYGRQRLQLKHVAKPSRRWKWAS